MGEVEMLDVELVQAVTTDPYNNATLRDPWSNI
jgi:hypothetical protein